MAVCMDCGENVVDFNHTCAAPKSPRPLPSQVAALPDWAKTINHPRRDEYVAYCRRRRFPLSFWDWLSHGEQVKPNDLQALMDQPYCMSPLRLRRIKQKGRH